jgi:uncharacterized membrane protein YgcG
MNTALKYFACAMVAAAMAPSLFSQAPQQKSAKDQLKLIKANNQKILEQQAATLQRLDEIQKEAGQLRIMVRRN